MLTEQRKRFVDEYIALKCKNQAQAAINAGYSAKSAASQACEILKDAEVASYFKSQKDELVRKIRQEFVFSASDAISTIYAIMVNPDAKDADRLKAAFDILDRAGFSPDEVGNVQDSEEELPQLLDALKKGVDSDD